MICKLNANSYSPPVCVSNKEKQVDVDGFCTKSSQCQNRDSKAPMCCVQNGFWFQAKCAATDAMTFSIGSSLVNSLKNSLGYGISVPRGECVEEIANPQQKDLNELYCAPQVEDTSRKGDEEE